MIIEQAVAQMEMMMTLVETVNSNPQPAESDLNTARGLDAMPTAPAAFAASLTTAGVAAGAVANVPAIGRAID